ncbi:Type II secretory pathway, component PulF [Izhakiella capsodis]|uniref:Type II secretory pathway, component PulF n=1 Tax=Izhakiella capsodis TaxID=1367852 RepID=A0A1I4W5P9_9GAMM|nr:type II secretion system F family protein [Izhakiella capsodis]SFN08496.1 Type II secretory pathway, component PulF [Izhakiella capsodis]
MKTLINYQFFNRIQLTLTKRSRIYSKLARFTENGVPLNLALDTLYEHVSRKGKKIKKIESVAIIAWRKKIRNGSSFSEAIADWISKEEASLINAGEMSGKLSEALTNAIEIGKAKKQIKKSLFGVAYPIVLICCLVFYLFIFGAKVVPAFEKILPVKYWHGTGKQMAYLSRFIMSDLIYYMAGLIVLILAIFISLPRWTGKIRSYIDCAPIYSTYRTIIGCQFLVSFCSLLQAGVPTPEIINILTKYSSPWYKERLVKARKFLLGGAANIGEALSKTELKFPSEEIIIDLQTYAALDGFEIMLSDLSKQWLAICVADIQFQMEIFKNIVIVLIGLTFMWIIDGMFALQQLISSSAMTI